MEAKPLFYLLMPFVGAQMLTAQIQKTTHVVDSLTGAAIPFVSVEIQNQEQDSKIISQTVSNQDGYSIIKFPQAGPYYLNANTPGYADYKKQIAIDGLENDTLTVRLAPAEVNEIEGIVIKANKGKTFERKIDRFIFNTKNSIVSSGVDGLQVLGATPLLNVDDEGNITMIGKDKVGVLINGRASQLSGSTLATYLKSLRADDIERVEVITIPPSKYEAEGNSGLVNIVLKKNNHQGFSGSVATSYRRSSKNGFSNNTVINFASGKINSSLKVSQADTDAWNHINLNIYQSDTQMTLLSKYGSKDRNYAIDYSLDYNLSENTAVGLTYNHSGTRLTRDFTNQSITQEGTDPVSTVLSNAVEKQNTSTDLVNLYLDTRLDDKGKRMTLTGSWFGSPIHTPFSLSANPTPSFGDYQMDTRNRYNIYSGQADFNFPLKTLVAEFGGKFTQFNADDLLDFYLLDNSGLPVLSPERGNHFNYKENNWASYVSFSKSFGEKWQAKAGIRYEYTTLNGAAENGLSTTDHYGKIFPSIYLSFKPNAKETFALSYSKRVTRPQGAALNPSRFYSDPVSFVQGNPFLRPSYTDNFELTAMLGRKLSLSGYYQSNKDGFGQVMRLADGMRETAYSNNYNERNWGATVNYTSTFFKRWDFQGTANYAYTQSHGYADNVIGLTSNALYLSVNNVVHLNREKTFSFILSFWDFLPHSKGNFKFENVNNLSAGLRASLLNRSLQINLTAQDLLKGMKFNGNVLYSGYYLHTDSYHDVRMVNLSITYLFGNNKVKGVKRTVDLEDTKRAN